MPDSTRRRKHEEALRYLLNRALTATSSGTFHAALELARSAPIDSLEIAVNGEEGPGVFPFSVRAQKVAPITTYVPVPDANPVADAERVAAEIGASVKDLGPAYGREARAVVVSSHLMGLSFSDNPETRDASLILSSLSSLEVGFELTESAKDPSKCSVDDLGVRLAAPDHVIEALDGLSRHASLFGKVVRNLVHETSPSVDGGSNPTVGDGQVAGVEKAAPATDATKITVTPEVIEAVAEHLFDTGVETPMINNLRSIAACLRNDLDDPVEVAASVDPTSRSHALFSQLADAIEEENERKRVFHSAQRTQVVAAKRFEDASSAVQEIELQIRKLATGEQA